MKAALCAALLRIRTDPTLLGRSLPALRTKLHGQGNTDAMGTGNQPTDQEVSFAGLLEDAGFQFLPKGTDIATCASGCYYRYQVNGTQQALDFQVQEKGGDGTWCPPINMDLKRTSTDVFFLNDGWFSDDVIYIISWERRISEPRKRIVKEKTTYIGLGAGIPTAEETACMKVLQEMRAKINAEMKGVGSLSTYVRFANRYSCQRFTPEVTEVAWDAVHSSLSSSSPSASVAAAVEPSGGAGAETTD